MVVNDPVLMNDWHPVARATDIPDGGALPVRLLGEDLVLWRLGQRIMAWQDLCIHRGTRLSLGRVEGESLTCPYHGWTYDTEGRCIYMPAHPEQQPPDKARVHTYPVTECYGLVWVALGEPAHDIAPFPEWDDPTYRRIPCGPYRFHAAGPRVVENFLDVAHFPFVHEGLLGERSHTEIPDYQVDVGEDGITANDIRIWQPNPDGTGKGKWVSYTYRVFRPLSAYFVKEAQARFAIFLAVTPVEELESLGWMLMVMNYGHDKSEEELRHYQDQIAYQDVPIVESQRPERLPLDLQAELHLRSDRTAIAYRKWLNQLGLSFGTA